MLRQELLSSALCSPISSDEGPENLFSTYNEVLSKLAEKFAPAKMLTIRRQPIAVWYDDERVVFVVSHVSSNEGTDEHIFQPIV